MSRPRMSWHCTTRSTNKSRSSMRSEKTSAMSKIEVFTTTVARPYCYLEVDTCHILMPTWTIVDTVLDDCYQLISLFFMTVGRTQEAPAVYVPPFSTQTAVLINLATAIPPYRQSKYDPCHIHVLCLRTKITQRLLDHLQEAGFYSKKDLISIGKKLEEWQESVERGKEHHSPHLLTLLEARMALCRTTLQQLEHELSHLTPELESVYEELVSILRSLSGCNARSKVNML